MNPVMLFSEPLLLGLSMGPLCLLTCSPLIAPVLLADICVKWRDTAKILLAFLLGRLAGYMAVGFLCGIAGMTLRNANNRVFWAIWACLAGVILLLFGLPKNFPAWGLCRYLKLNLAPMHMALALGLFSGINLCPPFIAAIAGAVATRSMIGAMLFFLMFFITTSLYFPMLLILGRFSRIEAARQIGRICLILSGAWYIGKGLTAFFS